MPNSLNLVDPTDRRPSGPSSDFERQLTTLRVENQRLRNLLRVSDGVEPPPEQPTLTPTDPGLVTNSSPLEAKLALYTRLFAARKIGRAHV